MWIRCPSMTIRLSPVWALKAFWGGIDEPTCGYNDIWGQEKACVRLRDIFGPEAWKAQAGKTRFVVRRIKSLRGLGEPLWAK